jgi:sugar lactone lactonase YvrE
VTRITSDGTNVVASGTVGFPTSVAVGPDGSVFVTDGSYGRVDRFDDAGSLIGTFGSPGNSPGQLANTRGVAVANDGTVYVADVGNGYVHKWTSSGSFLGTLPNACPGSGKPFGIGVDPDGNVWVACFVDQSTQDVVRKVAPNGTVLLTLTGFGQPADLGFDSHGQVHIVNFNTGEVRTYTLGGTYVDTLVPSISFISLEIAANGKLYLPSVYGPISVFDPPVPPDTDGDGIPDAIDVEEHASVFSDVFTRQTNVVS